MARRHVFADLKPYICTFSGCEMELKTFPTRKMWEEHEFSRYREQASWGCPECPSDFATLAESYDHFEASHEPVRDGQLPNNAAQGIIWRQPHIASFQCPLCLCIPGDSRRNFVKHVGRHIEGIALSTLPREDSSETDSDPEYLEIASLAGSHNDRISMASYSTDPRPFNHKEDTIDTWRHADNTHEFINEKVTPEDTGRLQIPSLDSSLLNHVDNQLQDPSASVLPSVNWEPPPPCPTYPTSTSTMKLQPTQSPPAPQDSMYTPPEQPYPVYPIPVTADKLEKALRLYRIYKSARYEEDLAWSNEQGYYPSELSTPTPRSPTSRISLQQQKPESNPPSDYSTVANKPSGISFEGNESLAKAKTELSTWDGKKVKIRTAKGVPKARKAKIALIRHLGSCWVCHKRTVRVSNYWLERQILSIITVAPVRSRTTS